MQEIIVEKLKKERGVAIGKPGVRFTYKSLYINARAGKMLTTDYITISVMNDATLHAMRLIPSSKEYPNSFKLSDVCETNGAKRIETNRSLEAILNAGFPKSLLGKYLPVVRLFDGSLLINIDEEQFFNKE